MLFPYLFLNYTVCPLHTSKQTAEASYPKTWHSINCEISIIHFPCCLKGRCSCVQQINLDNKLTLHCSSVIYNIRNMTFPDYIKVAINTGSCFLFHFWSWSPSPFYPPFFLLWTLSALPPSHFIFHHCLCYNLHCIYNFQAFLVSSSSRPLMSVLSSFLSSPVSFVSFKIDVDGSLPPYDMQKMLIVEADWPKEYFTQLPHVFE